jgi:GH3 auxin-responsive promoter
MLRPLLYRALNALPLAAFRRAANEFDAALANPEEVQQRLLLNLVRRNQGCTFGRRHGFGSISTVSQYQERVPIVTYDDLESWIESIKEGERAVLTSEPVLAFEKSSGSASAAKYIPYTHTLRKQFQSALAPWITDMHRAFPGIGRGCAYWLVTPLSCAREVTKGGIPVGFESDTEYFGPIQRWILRKTMAVPLELARVSELEDCIYLTLRFLLQSRSLTFISVWSPSFLLILLDRLEQHSERLIRDLLNGKASVAIPIPPKLTASLVRDARQAFNLQAMLRRGRIEPGHLWPRLELISCWTSAASASVKDEVQQRFPGVSIQGKGLLATEGIVSIPINQYKAPVAAITSHFLEFCEEGSGKCRTISELEEGRDYSVILTTGGGLWRYELADRVRVTSFAERTPLLEFIGKEDCVSDLRGEKLNAIFVANTLAGFDCCRTASFAMLAPSQAGIPHYTLFLESGNCQPDLLARLDERLQANPHYAYCRRIGQLSGLRLFLIRRDAHDTYLKHCAGLGQRPGNVKTTALHPHPGWERVFSGTYVETPRAEVCA